MLGLKRGTVKLAQHHDEWAMLFKKEKKVLLETFGDLIIEIVHVGSTAIPGIPAKPIIDMNVAISSLDEKTVGEFIPLLQKLGYSYMHQFPGRRFFAKGPEGDRTHHLNLVLNGSDSCWFDPILFRDYLRHNKSAREEYTALKEELAEQFVVDRKSYSKGKEAFIERTINNARAENTA